jgi:hypothetical protein
MATKKVSRKAPTRRRTVGRSGDSRRIGKTDKPSHGPGKKPRKVAGERKSTTRKKTRATKAARVRAQPAKTQAKKKKVTARRPSNAKKVQRRTSGKATAKKKTVRVPNARRGEVQPPPLADERRLPEPPDNAELAAAVADPDAELADARHDDMD